MEITSIKQFFFLQTCFSANIVCLVVSGIGVILLAVDLKPGGNQIEHKVELIIQNNSCAVVMNISASHLVFHLVLLNA